MNYNTRSDPSVTSLYTSVSLQCDVSNPSQLVVADKKMLIKWDDGKRYDSCLGMT